MPPEAGRRPLQVVHFSTADNDGGSGRSAYRIHSGLRAAGHTSRMLVGYKVTDDPDVDTVWGRARLRAADIVADAATRRLGLQYAVVPSSYRVRRHPWLASPDIIQLFNLHGAYFTPRLLPWLSARAPLVWRLSDMWAATGHCAYAGACEKWRTGCGGCPDLESYPGVGRDFTASLWRMKDRIYSRLRMTLVAPSSWTERIARESPLLNRFPVVRIPNGLDTRVFQPLDQVAARRVLGIPEQGTAILFSAHVAHDNPRKGSDVLKAALTALGACEDAMLLVAGVGADHWQDQVPQRVVPLGYLRDDRLIAASYAAADLVVVPSAVENLPNTVLEAMACARPVVAFDTGGTADAVRHEETGLVVPTGDAGGLAAAMARLLDDEALRDRLGRAALERARAEYAMEVQHRRFERLYDDILGSRAA